MPSDFNFVNNLLGKEDPKDVIKSRSVRGITAPQTFARTDHALSIRVQGQTIGYLQDWSPTQARSSTHLYEINSAGPGLVSENIPGPISGLTVNVGRVDLYSSKMENVWGSNFDIVMLTDQNNPLSINERWDNPDGTIEVYTYTGCWFTSLGRAHSAGGDRITRASASLTYVRKYKVGEIQTRIEDIVGGVVKRIFS